MATGTACFVPALPSPTPLSIQRSLGVIDDEDKRLIQVQHKIEALSKHNHHHIRHSPSTSQPDTLIKYFPDVPFPSRPPPSSLRGPSSSRGSRPSRHSSTTTHKKKKVILYIYLYTYSNIGCLTLIISMFTYIRLAPCHAVLYYDNNNNKTLPLP